MSPDVRRRLVAAALRWPPRCGQIAAASIAVNVCLLYFIAHSVPAGLCGTNPGAEVERRAADLQRLEQGQLLNSEKE